MQKEYQQLSLDEALRNFYKKEGGCVLRAASSLFEVQPTEDQWDERIEVLEGLGPLLDVVLGLRTFTDWGEVMDYAAANFKDHRRVLEFFQKLPNSDTPMGEKAREYTLTRARLSGWQIRRRLGKGMKVLVLTTTHLAHIVHIPGKGLVRLSDSPEYKIPLLLKYDALLFEKSVSADAKKAISNL